MPRVKRSVHARKKRRKVLGQAKGSWGLKKISYRYAKEQGDHSLTYAYRDRKAKKRTFRRLCITRISAGSRATGRSNTHKALTEHRDWLARFVAEQDVQTNEVGRCFALLPAFLELARTSGRRLDLLELGPSAGLNLLVDSYGYRYRSGAWGDAAAAVVLTGEERTPVPADLLAVELPIGRRRGVDLNPVDVATDEGVRLLTCFVWADHWHRLERLRHAIAVARANPPELVRGDYVELLPHLLSERDRDALTVVFQTVSTQYVGRERYDRMRL